MDPRRANPVSPIPLFFTALLLVATPGLAADWEATLGPYGGDVVALDTDAAGHLYAARGDDVFRTADGGATWLNVSGGGIGATILSLHVTPAGDVYAGVSSRGVWWSHDGGGSWDHDQITHNPHSGLGASVVAVGVDASGIIYANGFRSLNGGATWLDMDVSGRDFLFAGAEVYAGTSTGVHVSADGGATWTPRNAGMEDERVYALARNSQGHLFAGTWQGGVFRSTDAGASWVEVVVGLPSETVADLAVDGSDRVYAALYDGSLHRSDDAGASWQAVDAGLGGRGVRCLETGAGDAVFAGTEHHGVYRSADQGASWASLAAASMSQTRLMDLAGSRASGDLFLAAAGGGIYRSLDGGLNWHERSDGLPTTVVEALAGDSAGRLYAATREGVYASDDEGASWLPANAGHVGSPAAGVLVDDDDHVVAVLTDSAFFFEFTVVRSTDGGASWLPILDHTFGTLPTTASAYALDPEGRILIGGMSMATEGVIFLSDDDGQTWQEIVLGTLGVTDLAVDPAGVVYAALGDNTVHRSTDHGDTWTELPYGGWPLGTVGLLDVIGVDGQGAVIVSSRYAGFWRSTDGVDTWTTYDAGLPDDPYPAVTFLARVGGDLFAGSGTDGLFRRLSGGTAVDPTAAPRPLALRAIAPNPFNPRTRILYELAAPGPVRVTIHDLRGRRVRKLARIGRQAAGRHAAVWDGLDDAGRALPSGVYCARIETPAHAVTGRMVLAR